MGVKNKIIIVNYLIIVQVSWVDVLELSIMENPVHMVVSVQLNNFKVNEIIPRLPTKIMKPPYLYFLNQQIYSAFVVDHKYSQSQEQYIIHKNNYHP